ncbi:armadillo-type protein [Tribonema minus]|uniref:Armadillo-type protein n=1 Tax=Tribonema minus TaxID=303371 RepID=A0A835YT27_9STRA|nr:armadillo-type protein [Tribonema minus]
MSTSPTPQHQQQPQLDVQSLYQVLQSTFSSDPRLRKLAEQHVAAIKIRPSGAMLPLLQIVAEPSAPRDVRQAACITIKNVLREKWDYRVPENQDAHQQSLFSAAEREQTRAQLVETLAVEQDTSLRDLLAEAVKEVAAVDFPDHWPQFLPVLVGHIQTGDVTRVRNSLLAVRKVVKRYEYRAADQRQPLHEIIIATFPLLQRMFASLLPNPSDDASAIFWSTTQFALPAVGPEALDLNAWLEMVGAALERPVQGQPEDLSQRPHWPGWKVKKWACQIASRIFSRYGNPHFAGEEHPEFAAAFSKTMAPRLLEKVMHLLALRPRGEYCTDRVVHCCITYVNSSIELSHTYKLLKPHLDFLLFQVVFPLLCLRDDDLDLFESDPHEFVHRANDPMQDFLDPKLPAINLILDMVKYRPKDSLHSLLTFITQVLNRYAAAPPEQRDYRQKDGALVALGSMHEFLKKKKQYAGSLEGLLVAHVLPEFHSPLGFMRSRACWMMQHFADISFSNEANQLQCLMLTVNALQDKSLPVQIEAANSLKFLIESTDAAETALLPILPAMLDQYFAIMQQIGNDLVVQGLETIIDKFGDHIGPHALTLIQKLSDCFMEYAKEGYEDDDAAMAAGQCMEAVTTVLHSAHRTPNLYPAMEECLMPMLRTILSNDGEYIEYFENAVEVIAAHVSPTLWSTFPLLFDAFDKWAADYVTNIRTPIENFISRDSKTYACGATPQGVPYVTLVVNMARAGVPYVTLVVNMAHAVLADQRQTEAEGKAVAQLLSSTLHNCRGLVDAHVPAVLDIVAARMLGMANTHGLLTALCEALCAALHYDAALALRLMEAQGTTERLLAVAQGTTQRLLAVVLKAMTTEGAGAIVGGPRKAICLGLSSLLNIPLASLPPIVQNHMPLILSQLVALLARVSADASAAAQREGDAGDEGEDSEGEGEGGGTGGGGAGGDEFDDEEGFAEEQDVPAVQTAYEMRKINGDNVSSPFDEWYDDGDEEEDDDDDFESAIDSVNAVAFFYDAYRAAHAREAEAYALIQAACQELLVAAAAAAASDAQAAAAAAGAAPA